ncbi:MAG: hypothetical protein CMJ83_11930 [Planctomycetes bacterium]|nr:hypothetical protein [Planctomycetota bacterium]
MLSLQSVVLLAALTGTPVEAPAAAGSLAADFGFINVESVILQYKKTAEISGVLRKRLEQEKAAVAMKKDRLRARLASLDAGTLAVEPKQDRNAAVLERIRAEKDIALERVEIELSEKNNIIQLEQDLVAHTKKVYDEIRREAEVIARERGLKAVFMVANPKIEGRTRSEVNSEILVRPVLWFDPALDLTTETVQRLNR